MFCKKYVIGCKITSFFLDTQEKQLFYKKNLFSIWKYAK